MRAPQDQALQFAFALPTRISASRVVIRIYVYDVPLPSDRVDGGGDDDGDDGDAHGRVSAEEYSLALLDRLLVHFSYVVSSHYRANARRGLLVPLGDLVIVPPSHVPKYDPRD